MIRLRIREHLSAITLLSIMLVVIVAVAYAQTGHPQAHGDEIVAVVSGHPIAMRQVEDRWQREDRRSFIRIQQQLNDNLIRALDEAIDDELLQQEAAKQRRTTEQLIADAVASASNDVVTDQEVRELYTSHGGPGRGISLEQAAPALRAHLQQRHRNAAKSRYLAELRAQSRDAISQHLQPIRWPVTSSTDNPTTGSSSAAVRIVEYSDFQCPYCRQVRPLLDELVKKYKGRVSVVWKNFPLPSHANAKDAGEAALCAQDQGRFWEYHDVLFANQSALAHTDLIRYAADVKLNTDEFTRCVRNGTHRARVSDDIEEGLRHGVTATPTVFINGRMIMGAAPLEKYESIIEEELTHAGTSAAVK